MSNDTKRMEEIQNQLVAHIQTQLTTDEDFMYVATMLLKHSMVLAHASIGLVHLSTTMVEF